MKLHTKNPPIVQVLFWAMVAFALARYLPLLPIATSPWLTILAATFGVVFLSSALNNFRRNKTTFNPLDPGQATTLVTDGIYRITRNPMYVGLVILLLTWCLYLGDLLAFVSIPLFITAMTFTQIKAEEEVLGQEFGENYLHYQTSVKRWLLF